MRIYIYVCVAVLTAMVSGCIVGPDGGYRRGGYSNDDYRGGDQEHNGGSDRGWNQQRRSHDHNNYDRDSNGGRNSEPYQPEMHTN
ncbi:MAG: hypothetical protein EPN62_05995 [Candidimonas sp.]|nr:MAG: hypothetical protein EPN77_04365 [Candidimonas sp.]TAM24665.1 MAG: hypothetical protein EPN62_05995 [Candidimonas sp.]